MDARAISGGLWFGFRPGVELVLFRCSLVREFDRGQVVRDPVYAYKLASLVWDET